MNFCAQQIATKQKDLKKKLRVTFAGEPGLDMGGLTKEWFLLLIRDIFQVQLVSDFFSNYYAVNM